MITRSRRLNLVLSLIVIFSMISASAGQAALANAPSRASPAQPELAPPPGRNGLGMGQAENGNPADAPIHLVDSVNVTNGNLLVSDLHVQINALGLPFGLQVAYNAQASADLNSYTPLGRKWTHSLNWYVALDGANNLAVHKGDGEFITYPLSCRQDVNRSGSPIDVLDIQLDAEAWNTALGDPGFESFFDVALPLDNRVDIRDVQVVGAAFNLTCTQVASAYWLWNESLADRYIARSCSCPAAKSSCTRARGPSIASSPLPCQGRRPASCRRLGDPTAAKSPLPTTPAASWPRPRVRQAGLCSSPTTPRPVLCR
jgi:hypothetical protein